MPAMLFARIAGKPQPTRIPNRCIRAPTGGMQPSVSFVRNYPQVTDVTTFSSSTFRFRRLLWYSIVIT